MAGSLICSDFAGQRLRYSFSQNDGGAHIAASEQLSLNGELFIRKDPFKPGEEVSKATFSLSEGERTLLRAETHNMNFELTAFVTKATVRSVGNGDALLFEDIVECRRSRYKGPPIP